MQLYNIVTKQEYESKGEKRTSWLNVGTLKVMDDSKKFITLNMFPNTSFYVFEQKPKGSAQTANSGSNSGSKDNTPEIQIDNDDIPF
jgi:single-stranded DNA-binding protein